MLFNSINFLIFFLIFISLYVLTRKHLRVQNILILCGSYIFYGSWDERFLVLIILSTITDYVIGLGIARIPLSISIITKSVLFLIIGTLVAILPSFTESSWILIWVAAFIALGSSVIYLIEKHAKNANKWYLLLSVVVNLGLLGVFKYANFFSESFVELAGLFGLHLDRFTLNVVLPVGISFYTFQTMSYSIDIYRGKLSPTKNLLEMASFVSFFPQLVAGPIERASHLLPQFFKKRVINSNDFHSGIWLFIWGLYKKIVIADNLSPIADQVFSNPQAMSTGDLLSGLLAFTFQIYCDFSGYSDMARGAARMLGFDLMLNFRLPYFSRTPSEFWQRWHISLSSWLRDYLYIPLGGNRGTTFNTYRNLSLTMLLGGLWHGANWTFIAWGAYQGLILVLYRICNVDKWISSSQFNVIQRTLRDILLTGLMFFLIVIGWLFFRASSIHDVLIFTSKLSTNMIYTSELWTDVLFYISPLVVFQFIQHYTKELEILFSFNKFIRYNFRLFVICSLIFLSSKGGQQFIYFDF